MLFFYIRHGDPIYNPDSLTPLGARQAEALSKRLALYGLDEIYSSTSERARQTAAPTAQLLKKEVTLLDFANEGHAWNEFVKPYGEGKKWLFQHPEARRVLISDEVRAMGHEWAEHPYFRDTGCASGSRRIQRESDAFFASLGYEHIGRSGAYRITRKNDGRVAMFAHQGFGMAFLSTLLDIPYPDFSMRFNLSHTGMTVIEFKDEGDGICVPCVLTLSSDSHLYREGLPTKYCNSIYF